MTYFKVIPKSYLRQLNAYAMDPNILNVGKEALLFLAKVIHLIGEDKMIPETKVNLNLLAKKLDLEDIKKKLEDESLSNRDFLQLIQLN